jgi:hypothetical protein
VLLAPELDGGDPVAELGQLLQVLSRLIGEREALERILPPRLVSIRRELAGAAPRDDGERVGRQVAPGDRLLPAVRVDVALHLGHRHGRQPGVDPA